MLCGEVMQGWDSKESEVFLKASFLDSALEALDGVGYKNSL